MKPIKFSLVLVLSLFYLGLSAQSFNPIPKVYRWVSNDKVAFSYNYNFTDSSDFSILIKNNKYVKVQGAVPQKFTKFPIIPKDAVNLTYSPDSTMLAFTRHNDLYVVNIATGKEKRLTFDGSELILNGYASWVYYEEILGRSSRYKAFWWSPDSKVLAFYRFDNSQVPLFPIYSAKGQSGSLNNTRYPKAGQKNPEVSIGFVDVQNGHTVWADFNPKDDQYFGIPFWSDDSNSFYISRMPRLQNQLSLYKVSPLDGSKTQIYHEKYKTWIDWIEGMLFGKKGIYMARKFETGWAQIYYLSYDGKVFKRLTYGKNWRINLLKADEKNNMVYFTAERDSRVKSSLYSVDFKGNIKTLTDTSYSVSNVDFSPDNKYFVANLSNFTTPNQIWIFKTNKPQSHPFMVANLKGDKYNASDYALPKLIKIKSKDGLVLYGTITYPFNFDTSKKYPVHVDLYGGPNLPLVRDRWVTPNQGNQWWAKNGIIEVVADCRAAGHNGMEGLDAIYRSLSTNEVLDFVDWAKYLQSLPYVLPNKIGVQGFSFGGTMTCLLLMDHSNYYHYGIAGGGVYDWSLYDSHYTERYMDTPQNNPKGYDSTRVINHAKNYPVNYDNYDGSVMLKLTHGTGDDNVHFQNTLQLIDALQKQNAKFDFMIYPDGMHGYHGYQARHFEDANHEFWKKYLLGK